MELVEEPVKQLHRRRNGLCCGYSFLERGDADVVVESAALGLLIRSPRLAICPSTLAKRHTHACSTYEYLESAKSHEKIILFQRTPQSNQTSGTDLDILSSHSAS